MSDLRTSSPTTAAGLELASTRPGVRRAVLRWMVSFAGFPLGGLAAFALTGPVDGVGPALAGGLLTGVALGAIQAWALGQARPGTVAWILATTVGLMTGLALGAALVDYRTDLGSLALQGAVNGAVVGLAQATVLLPRIGVLALAWPVALSGIWAAGWAITASYGVDVDKQFTIFGSSGALATTLLTSFLPLVLNSRHYTEKSAS
jgi:hypothetical protein